MTAHQPTDVFIDYDLPPHLVARTPLAEKEKARLLCYDGSGYHHRQVGDLPRLVPPDTVFIYNNSRVLPAWLQGVRVADGKTLTVNLVAQADDSEAASKVVDDHADNRINKEINKDAPVRWWVLVGGVKKPMKNLSLGDEINFALPPYLSMDSYHSHSPADEQGSADDSKPLYSSPCMMAEMAAQQQDDSHDDTVVHAGPISSSKSFPISSSKLSLRPFLARLVEKDEKRGQFLLQFLDSQHFDQQLQQHGLMPIPPYLKRAPTASDSQYYQPLFAKHNGSVASPTASLHFSAALRQRLVAAGCTFLPVTLHVGLGTFMPMKGDPNQHTIHAEWGQVGAETATAYNLAVAAGRPIVAIGTTVLRLLETASDQHGQLHPFLGKTSIFIKPPYRIKTAHYLMTNFHLPHSTLLLLVNSFIGASATKSLYELACRESYRFYSYGDACLLRRGDAS